MNEPYSCPKCACHSFVLDEIRGPSGGLLAYLNVDDQKLTLVICRNCRFAEIYAMSKKSFASKHDIQPNP